MSENKQAELVEVNQNTQPRQSGATNPENVEERLKIVTEKNTQMDNELKQKDVELSTLKARITQLEQEVQEAQKFKAQHLKEAEEVEVLKEKSEDTLTKAKGIIFEKVKLIKNQELQIEALNQQINALKDVVTITKDLLEIRNLEIKQLESKIQCIEDKFGAEKERYELMHKKLESMIRYNGELKREYETQLCLFSALRERYNEKELAKGVLEGARMDVGTAEVARADAASTDAASTDAAVVDAPRADVASTSTSKVNGEVAENNENKEDK